MFQQIELKDRIITYPVFFRNKKTIRIRIALPGKVVVSAPQGTPLPLINDLVRKKEDWIIRKIDDAKRKIGVAPKEMICGETFLYLGKYYQLKIEYRCKEIPPQVYLDNNFLVLETGDHKKESLESELKKWYTEKTLDLAKDRAEYYRKKVGKRPFKVKSSSAKTSWGSCTAKGNILINWRAVMAPFHVFDYLIVHELCHLMWMDHSDKFWALVGSVLPDYKKSQKWLKDNGHRLLFVFDDDFR